MRAVVAMIHARVVAGRDVLERVRPGINTAGDVIDDAGAKVGTHTGIANYTVGQRQGLPSSSDGARFVTRVDAKTNTIVIGREDELFSNELIADEVNLIRPERFAAGATDVLAMVRYRAVPAPAKAIVNADGSLQLTFEQGQRAITPGQLVAFFDPAGEEVLGAATIREAR